MEEKIVLNRIYNIDCLEGMKKMKEEGLSPDIIVTSPPYNIGIKYESYNDEIDFEEYLDWIENFGSICKDILSENGSLFFNIGDKVGDELKAFEVARRLKKNFCLQNTIHWIKHISVPEENISIGHFKPVNSDRFLNNCHEYIFHFTKTKNIKLNKLSTGVPYKDKTNLKRWKKQNGDRRDRGNIWFIPYNTVQSEKIHPAIFPRELPRMCIKLHGFTENTLVFDPFSGIGTTCIVAKFLGCKFLGFDIDKKSVEMSNTLLKEINGIIEIINKKCDVSYEIQ